MRKIIISKLVALSLLVSPAFGAARAENAIADRLQNKGGLGAYDIGTGQLIPLNIRLNSGGDQIVDGGTNTFTVMGVSLDAIEVAVEAIEGASNTIVANQEIMKLQLGVIEGNGTTTVANQEIMKLQLGVIEGNGTTNVANNATYAATRELQLGVIEGNGTTLNVTATALLAEAVTIKTSTDAIEVAIEGIGVNSQNIQGATPDGVANTANPVVAGGVDGSANVQAWLSDTDGHQQVDVLTSGLPAGAATEAKQDAQILQLGVIEGNGTTAVARLDTALLQLGVIEGNGTTLNVTATDILAEAVTIKTNTGTVAGAVAAGQMQVDVVAELPAGTQLIGNVKISDGAQTVDVSSANTLNVGNQTASALADSFPLASTSKDITDSGTASVGGKVPMVYNGVSLDLMRGDTNGIDISDISRGTQTNDVKVTLDSETVELGASSAQVGNVAIADGSAVTADVGDGASVDYLYVRLTDGTDSSSLDGSGNLEVVGEAGGDVKVTLDGETVELGAGTASIGTLGANSGVDIGDVTINNAAAGAAVNVQDGGNSLTVDGTVTIADASTNTIGARAVLDGSEWHFVADYSAAQTDTVVKACPAGKRIVFTYAFYTANDTQTFQFQDEDDTDVSPTVYCTGAGSGAVEPGAKDMPLWILGTDKDLEIDTTAAVDHGIRAVGYITE